VVDIEVKRRVETARKNGETCKASDFEDIAKSDPGFSKRLDRSVYKWLEDIQKVT
jgi:hypothetical protein